MEPAIPDKAENLTDPLSIELRIGISDNSEDWNKMVGHILSPTKVLSSELFEPQSVSPIFNQLGVKAKDSLGKHNPLKHGGKPKARQSPPSARGWRR